MSVGAIRYIRKIMWFSYDRGTFRSPKMLITIFDVDSFELRCLSITCVMDDDIDALYMGLSTDLF